MSPVVYLVVKVAFLALLWVFVLVAVLAVRADLFGVRARPGKMAAPPRRSPAPSGGRPRSRRDPRRLVITEGSLVGTSIGLGSSPITIGRAPDSTLVITDDYASNNHARLVPRDGQWLVEDLGSTNGTYLDRAKVTGPTVVVPGVPVRIGTTVLELRT